MKAMEEKILTCGQVLPGNVLKVGNFLNQQLDVDFLTEVGKEIARLYDGVGVTKIITIEASGIAIAVMAAQAMHVPCVIVKKHSSANQSKDLYTAEIASFTHGNTYTAAVAKEYINSNDNILIVDDFLACGNAIIGMKKIIDDAGAKLAGCAIAIEKCFQNGGNSLRASGIRVESLAMIKSMSENFVEFVKP
ncbi:MAG: xanthine phosphoribosyltransferase [Eubacteriales bacterium]|nr:xanthine phosphoribosyltransferase [Eubacteriales bacterium]